MASTSSQPTNAKKATKGLATVAMLKANFDGGRDHIEMFLPFVLDVIQSVPTTDFSVDDVASRLEVRHTLSIPTPFRLIPMGDWRDSIAAKQAKKRARWRRQDGS
ncbi:MAG: hypothetical protein HYY78_07185 [Betaproteobacteria bacterium]|nr:hypothetical protein [Betaproteobacteria bacterium]